MNKKNKKVLTLSILVLVIIASGISLYQHQIKVQAQEAQAEVTEALAATKQAIAFLYLDKQKEFLGNTVTKATIKKAEESLQQLSSLMLNKSQQAKMTVFSQELDEAKQMFALETALHKKYKNEKITSDQVEFSKEEKTLDLLKKTKPAFVKKMTEIIKESKTQLAITKELLQFFEQYDTLKVKETISRADYDPFKEKVAALTSEPFKASLSDALTAIQKLVEENEEKVLEEKVLNEEKAKIEKEQEKVEVEKDAQTHAQTEEEKETIKETSPATETSLSEPAAAHSKDASKSQTSADSVTPSTTKAPAQQTGIEGIIARSSTSQSTNQIIGVVASGSSANVYLFEKNGSQWQTILSMPGRVGYNGVGSSYEGSGRTPKGAYSLGFAFGTGPNPGTNLSYSQITNNSYWISNPDDSQYNTWQERTSSSSLDEHLSDYQTQYKYGLTLNYNNGVNGGSAFFLHVNGNGATAGCVSVSQSNMLYLMQRIRSGAYIINVTSESELANY